MSNKIFMMDENVNVNDIKQEDQCYIIAKNGIFFKDNQEYMESCIEIKTIAGLQAIKPYIKWRYPKISSEQFKMVYCFFQNVYDELKSECMVLIGWNKSENKIEIISPHIQKVSHASISYKCDILTGVTIIGSIHSHANMSAFHSGVDVHDEINFDGLHITLGKFAKNDKSFEISSQITSGTNREDIHFNDIIEGISVKYAAKLSMSNLSSMNNKALIENIMADNCDIEYTCETAVDNITLTKDQEIVIEKWFDSIDNNRPNTFVSSNGYINKFVKDTQHKNIRNMIGMYDKSNELPDFLLSEYENDMSEVAEIDNHKFSKVNLTHHYGMKI